MAGLRRHSVWLNRVVLTFATLLFARIAFERIRDPVAAEAPHHITLASPEALTNTRVSGGVFLAIALLLAVSVVSRERHLAGLALLATLSSTLAIVRIAGLIIDGPAPFTYFVLKPELVITALSVTAFLIERSLSGSARVFAREPQASQVPPAAAL